MKLDAVRNTIESMAKKLFSGVAMPPVMLWGPPGVGKSDIIRSAANTLGIELRDVRLAQLDAVDLRGLPEVEHGRTKWAVPAFFPTDPKSRGILFLDELSSADPSIQAAAYQLMLDRRVGEYVFPDGWFICAAGNRADDQASSLPMSSALANRLLHIDIEPDPEVWCRWAVQNKIAPEIVAFMRFSPKSLFQLNTKDCERGWASPRSWANVSKVLTLELDQHTLRECIVGLVGVEATAKFMVYRELYNAIGNIKEMLLSGKKIPIPQKADICYALAGSLAYWVWRGDTAEESELLLDGFMQTVISLPKTFACLALLDASATATSEQSDSLCAHKNYKRLEKLIADGGKR